MLKTRLIPTLLLKNGRMVKTIKFNDLRDVGDPVTAARVYNAQNVDELIFLDITASQEKRSALFDIISQVTKECFMPLAVGGGVRTVEDIRQLLLVGADKVVINTVAVQNPSFVSEAAKKFGRQCVIISIDVKKKNNGKFEVFIEGGKVSTGLEPMGWARRVEELGAGEIFITSIDKDGTMQGYEIELIKSISNKVTIPVIASAGAGTLQDLVEAIKAGGVSAVAAASIFHFTDQSPIKARSFMKNTGLNVRFV